MIVCWQRYRVNTEIYINCTCTVPWGEVWNCVDTCHRPNRGSANNVICLQKPNYLSRRTISLYLRVVITVDHDKRVSVSIANYIPCHYRLLPIKHYLCKTQQTALRPLYILIGPSGLAAKKQIIFCTSKDNFSNLAVTNKYHQTILE